MRSIGPGACSLRVPLPWVLTLLSCQQRARSRAGGTEQQLVAVIALASSPGWTTSARAAYQSCARSWTTRRSSRRLPPRWQRRLLSRLKAGVAE